MKSLLFLLVAVTYFERSEGTITIESTTIGSTIIEPTTATPILLSDTNKAIIWSPKSTESVVIEVFKGYKISVNVTECIMEGENGDYVTISADENSNGLLFTYEVSRQPSYIFNNNRLYGYFFGGNASNFTAVFTQVGDALTATSAQVPIKIISLPVPRYNDSSLLVFLAGRSASEYAGSINSGPLISLRNAIGAMASEYCLNKKYPLDCSVTSDNVIINHLLPCTVSWPNSGTCVQLNFSVPVYLVEDKDYSWKDYHLTTAHLRILWQRYAGKYLPDGTTIYSPPGDGSLKWGITAFFESMVIS